MKTLIVAVAAALVSAASVTTVGVFSGVESEKELAVALPVDVASASSLIPFLEKAARERGITHVRAYTKDVFIPLEQATVSFVRNGSTLSMHVAVESEYRFAKSDRAAALAHVKSIGDAIFIRALQLQGMAQS
ncbi:MAG: hypothetical protein FJ137_13315 [Deltaproteobacteria bacterium]|nr:hypothetical protein [Deltaproteobacteria bacterium]